MAKSNSYAVIADRFEVNTLKKYNMAVRRAAGAAIREVETAKRSGEWPQYTGYSLGNFRAEIRRGGGDTITKVSPAVRKWKKGAHMGLIAAAFTAIKNHLRSTSWEVKSLTRGKELTFVMGTAAIQMGKTPTGGKAYKPLNPEAADLEIRIDNIVAQARETFTREFIRRVS